MGSTTCEYTSDDRGERTNLTNFAATSFTDKSLLQPMINGILLLIFIVAYILLQFDEHVLYLVGKHSYSEHDGLQD